MNLNRGEGDGTMPLKRDDDTLNGENVLCRTK